MLRYTYLRPPPEMPSLSERIAGHAKMDVAAAERMGRAWRGAVSGEIVFEVY